jgi:hypothetical protein
MMHDVSTTNNMKNKIYHTIGTIPKSNTKIVENGKFETNDRCKSDYPYISYYFEHIWCIFGITVLKFNNFIVQYYVVPIQESQRSLVSNLPFSTILVFDFGIVPMYHNNFTKVNSAYPSSFLEVVPALCDTVSGYDFVETMNLFD